MTKKPQSKPKSPKAERREALDRMTKAELVKTIVALDARQTKLLNQIAGLEATCVHRQLEAYDMQQRLAVEGSRPTSEVFADPGDAHETLRTQASFPWEQS